MPKALFCQKNRVWYDITNDVKNLPTNTTINTFKRHIQNALKPRTQL